MSFLQSHSNDEYVDSRKDTFKIETLYIILLVAGVNVLQGIIRGEFSGHVIVCGVLLVIAVLYYTLRSSFTGIEHPDVATKATYKRQKRMTRASIATTFLIFFFINIGDKLFFD